MRNRVIISLWAGIILLAGGVNVSAAMPEDSFVAAKKFDSRYFTVQLQAGTDELSLVQSLNIGPEHTIFNGQELPAGASFSPNNLGDVLDALFSWSCGVLDMQLYTYRGNIKVVRDENSLSDIYRNLYGVDRKGEKGFYVYEINTLYVVAADFTKEIVGHEIAHAIISNFFVVQPPTKVQEVLAGYIEYQLRKKSTVQIPAP